MTLLYLHGFNSSPQSFKARLLASRYAALGRAHDFLCPELPHEPAAAARLLESLVVDRAAPLVVGSSLGGYYATWLAERHGLRAVLVNPAVRPYELLQGLLGPQKNLYTGAEYLLTQDHVDELRALETPTVTPARYLLMVTTGDEVLDYRLAVDKYRGCRQLIIPGGDHGFSDFAAHLDAVLAFGNSD